MKLPHRLRQDFRLSILVLLCACALGGITPFAIWRFINEQWIAAAVDLLIVFSITAAVIYAWRTEDTARAGLVLAHVTSGGAVAMALIVGEPALFWMYPALITSFFLAAAWVALYCMIVALAVLLVHGGAFTSAEQMISFSATVVVVSACAYIFALRSERQRDQLKQLASRDPLTGVENRRAMDDMLQLAVARHNADQASFGLILADLDHFKQINDLHGHSVGDAILLKFSRLLEMNTRRTDKVFRFGGEEFVILLPDVELAQLAKAAEHIQQVIRASLRSPGGRVTASFGIALLQSGESPAAWFARADQALYRAKQNGRDRIESADT